MNEADARRPRTTRIDITPANLETDSMTARTSNARTSPPGATTRGATTSGAGTFGPEGSGPAACGATTSDASGSSSRGGRPALVGAFAAVLVLLLLLVVDPTGLAGQQGPGASLGSQSMRPYAHVFWAYALAWALVLGWVVSISRRWSRVEDDLERRSGSE